MGVASSISDAIARVFEFISSLFARRNSEVDRLRDELKEVEDKLSAALSDGRITDSMALCRRRDELRDRLEKLWATMCMVAVLASAAAVSGCRSAIVPVVGERVFVVTEATSIDLPAPLAPAKLWYVVDDVCLKEWLGIETVLSTSTNGVGEVLFGK